MNQPCEKRGPRSRTAPTDPNQVEVRRARLREEQG